ncbi:putative RiPP precursor [Mesorhizobium cantuariense]|uniref:RiPP n=1 Tax=Mesorhizobium cantuariense TaxID=1300275 RepID=A0ABV7MTA7_9HYPH
MKKTYEKPVLVKRQKLSSVTAQQSPSSGPID